MLQKYASMLKSYLEELKDKLIKKDEDNLLQEFKTSGVFTVLHDNEDLERELKAVDYMLHDLNAYEKK